MFLVNPLVQCYNWAGLYPRDLPIKFGILEPQTTDRGAEWVAIVPTFWWFHTGMINYYNWPKVIQNPCETDQKLTKIM